MGNNESNNWLWRTHNSPGEQSQYKYVFQAMVALSILLVSSGNNHYDILWHPRGVQWH